MPKITTQSASRGCSASAISAGSTMARYVPIVGMNCETSPVQMASGNQYGTPSTSRKTAVATLHSAASTSRESTYPPVFSTAMVQTVAITRCCRGGKRLEMESRSFGPSADM